MLASTASSQTSLDSLKTISVQRWKLVRLFELASSAASCDSLQAHQERQIQAGISLQAASDSLLSLTTYQLILAKTDTGLANQQLANQKELTKAQARKKRKWMFIAGGILAVWLGSEVLTD